MGREAICKCNWAGVTADVKVLLESQELILRGGIRKRVLLAELKQVMAGAGGLSFNAGADHVELFLDADQAAKWASAIKAGPASLARKLGITDKSVVRTIGDMSDEALSDALAEAAQISPGNPSIIVASIETPQELAAALKKAEAQLAKGIPIWLVYPKGPGHPLNESVVRRELLARGMVDTKVAAVSTKLTAIRFNLRRAK